MTDCVDDDTDDDGQPDPGPGPDSLAGARMQLLHELEHHQAVVANHPSPLALALEADNDSRVDPGGMLRRLAARVDAMERAQMGQHELLIRLALSVNALCMRACGRESP